MAAIDFPLLLGALQRCDASYEPDDATARQRFAALGCTVLDRISEEGCQGVAVIAPDGVPELVITGTRFSEGPIWDRIVDLGQDADFLPVYPLSKWGGVAGGAERRADMLWRWCAPLFADRRPIRITGHSLGGQTALAMLGVAPLDQIGQVIPWEAPKAADMEFWWDVSQALPRVLPVVCGADPFFAWPPISGGLTHPPVPHLWLNRPGSWTMLEHPNLWPGADLRRAGDHDTATLIAAVRAIVAAQDAAQDAAHAVGLAGGAAGP